MLHTLGHHRRNRVWIFNWALIGGAAKWFSENSAGRLELFIPFSARRLPDLGTIFRSGFFPRLFRGSATKDYPEGKFPCLTCPLRPGMEPWGKAAASPEAVAKAEADGGIYQPYHYEPQVLLWKGDRSRRPNSSEWEEMMGYPRAWTDVPELPKAPHRRELARLRLLGNAWRFTLC